MNTRQLLSVGIDIGTTTTQVIFSHLELVNRAAVSQVPRYEFIKREISWQSPVFTYRKLKNQTIPLSTPYAT